MHTVVIASGPSLTAEDVGTVRQWRTAGACRRVYVVNASFRIAPWADLVFACDHMFWLHYYAEIKRDFQGELWTSSASARQRFNINFIPRESGQGLHPSPAAVCSNDNSGSQAVELAYKHGARRITLLGFDFKWGLNGKKHHHEDHPKPMVNATNIQGWKTMMALLAGGLQRAGVVLLNASRETAIESIPRVSLEDALSERYQDRTPARRVEMGAS